MAKFKDSLSSRFIFKKSRKHRLKYIRVLPSLITLLNGIFGFAAIYFASKGSITGSLVFREPDFTYFEMAGYMIILAMVADMLDGRVARMSQSTSSFGGQLDSLCDMISFSVAPAFLMLKVLENKLSMISDISPTTMLFFTRFFWITAAVYISCSAIRLARFNVENEEDESAHMSFWGLPSPAAAGVILSLVVFHQSMLPKLTERASSFYNLSENIIMICLPFVALGVAFLMVSRIRYSHVLNHYLRGKKPFGYFLRAIIFIVIIIHNFEAAMVLVFCGFAIGGPVKWAFHKFWLRGRSGHHIIEPKVSEEAH